MERGVGGRSPANIMTHLRGIDFPTDKDEIVEHAKQVEGPETEEVVGLLEKLPDRDYNTPAEILKEVGQIE